MGPALQVLTSLKGVKPYLCRAWDQWQILNNRGACFYFFLKFLWLVRHGFFYGGQNNLEDWVRIKIKYDGVLGFICGGEIWGKKLSWTIFGGIEDKNLFYRYKYSEVHRKPQTSAKCYCIPWFVLLCWGDPMPKTNPNSCPYGVYSFGSRLWTTYSSGCCMVGTSDHWFTFLFSFPPLE